mmetsp:Transcript_2817/g.6891  ORF Transcript_2817/g.6891 Transcript_2817/m.6891 type:complete len:158 (-) Transcript_2817:82-555(-)
MVVLKLLMKAEMENVTEVTTGPDFQWFFTIQCGNCSELREGVGITQEEKAAMSGSRGSAHLVQKCKLCSRECSVDVVDKGLAPYNAEHAGSFSPICSFECRGCTLVKWEPRGGFSCRGATSGKRFEDIDLQDEWCDYDEDADAPVSISHVEGELQRA